MGRFMHDESGVQSHPDKDPVIGEGESLEYASVGDGLALKWERILCFRPAVVYQPFDLFSVLDF